MEGALSSEAVVMSFRADAADTPIWAPVTLAAAASGYYLPEVATTTTANLATIIGVTVGPLEDTDNGYCNSTAGDMINVCTHGPAKCKVNGNSVNIADGDALVSTTTAGRAVKASVSLPTTWNKTTVETQLKILSAVFAMAMEASAADGDVVPVFVHGAQGSIA